MDAKINFQHRCYYSTVCITLSIFKKESPTSGSPRDLGQLIYEENFLTAECYDYEYDNAGNIVLRVDGMDLTEYDYVYAPSPYGDRLVSYNGETISYDSSGRTVVYRGKQITYLQADANKIASIGNVSFTYDADGMRRSKTVGGVTHYYTYDGIQLVKEEWGNNVMIFLYDALDSLVGMQYRNSTYASGVWDIYYYEKNLQGDIVAVYNSTGTKLISYDYDAWGDISYVSYFNGGANTSARYNPLRFRGYYYDDDLDLYYLATRYYDPEVCRFITADSYVSTGQGILGHNMYAYCNNNPIMYVDYSGESPIIYVLGFAITLGGIASIVSFAYKMCNTLNHLGQLGEDVTLREDYVSVYCKAVSHYSQKGNLDLDDTNKEALKEIYSGNEELCLNHIMVDSIRLKSFLGNEYDLYIEDIDYLSNNFNAWADRSKSVIASKVTQKPLNSFVNLYIDILDFFTDVSKIAK